MSGILIPNDVAVVLEGFWQDHIVTLDLQPLLPSDTNKPDGKTAYIEGGKSQALVNRYERDPKARDACLKKVGTICKVCEFDFRKEFGALGDGYIHVHHIVPISQRFGEYVLDPEKDLVPVCPNCHAMLHRKNPPYTVDELREIKKRVVLELTGVCSLL